MVRISRSRTLLTPCKLQENYSIQLLLNECHKKMPFIFSNLRGTILFISFLYSIASLISSSDCYILRSRVAILT